MSKQRSPHTQTQQNVKPEQTDLEPDQQEYEPEAADEDIYTTGEGSQTGDLRSPREVEARATRHATEPETEAHEGSISTRSPNRATQGITAHSATEESSGQEKVVSERPDAQAGMNQSRKAG